MLAMQSSFLSESPDTATANQVLCSDLSLLFSLLSTRLSEAIARTAGKPLADQFTQQLNQYAVQHGWNVLTGLPDLSELNRRVPTVDARMLSTVYQSYAKYAQTLARQVLGEQLLKVTLAGIVKGLPPHMLQLNEQHGIIH